MYDIQKKLDDLATMTNLPPALKRILRTREIFESNAIEGVGPDAPTTLRILDSSSLSREESSTEFIQWALTQGIKNDKKTYDVLGLAAARELSRNYALSPDRPITETDIRDLHEMIMKGTVFAGMYKPYTNEIQLNENHKTALPIETPAKMQEFCDWMNQLPTRGHRTLESIVRAAAIHGWIAHIHPFEDGNGRVSRLLANMALAREGMPPLILRHKGDRERYIDALAFSDIAGDISRLILIFIRSIERVIEELSDPQIAQDMFDEDINLRKSGIFKYWRSLVDEWTEDALVQLRLVGLTAKKVGDLQPSDFFQLRKGVPASRTWFLQIYKENEIVGIWYFGYLPGWVRNKLTDESYYPTLIFAYRSNDPNAVRPFVVPFRGDNGINMTQFMIEPAEKNAYVWGENLKFKRVSLKLCASEFASTNLAYSSGVEN